MAFEVFEIILKGWAVLFLIATTICVFLSIKEVVKKTYNFKYLYLSELTMLIVNIIMFVASTYMVDYGTLKFALMANALHLVTIMVLGVVNVIPATITGICNYISK